MACIVTQRGHAAGRTGMGAVMGSKRLKAVVVAGRKDGERLEGPLREAVLEYLGKIRAAPNYADKAAHGTSSAINWADDKGLLGSYNYRQAQFAGAAAIDGTSMDQYVEKLRGCQRCPVHCKAEVRLQTGPHAGFEGERPDFEPIASWGSKTGLADPRGDHLPAQPLRPAGRRLGLGRQHGGLRHRPVPARHPDHRRHGRFGTGVGRRRRDGDVGAADRGGRGVRRAAGQGCTRGGPGRRARRRAVRLSRQGPGDHRLRSPGRVGDGVGLRGLEPGRRFHERLRPPRVEHDARAGVGHVRRRCSPPTARRRAARPRWCGAA